MRDESELRRDVAHEEQVDPRTTDATRPLQPWSDAGRRVSSRARERRTGRAKQLARFNDALAEMIVRDVEEEQQLASLMKLAIPYIWGPLLLGAGVLIQRVTGAKEYTPLQLAAGLVGAVVIGLLIDPLWKRLRGAQENPDRSAPAHDADEFTKLDLQRPDDDHGVSSRH